VRKEGVEDKFQRGGKKKKNQVRGGREVLKISHSVTTSLGGGGKGVNCNDVQGKERIRMQ